MQMEMIFLPNIMRIVTWFFGVTQAENLKKIILAISDVNSFEPKPSMMQMFFPDC
jgi:uncharacterized membrane protein